MSIQTSFPQWVPSEIVDGYSEKGLSTLFKWQTEVISSQNSRNLVFCAPTSAGKSLVAELLGLQVALKGKRVLFVLPYIAVAKEKLSFIQKLWRRVDIQVAGYIGPTSAPSSEWTAAVCTLEKANSLISHAISDNLLEEYGMVIIDELHMVLDQSRGPTLEALLAKLNYYNSMMTMSDNWIEIVGMSATLPKVQQITEWLQAQVYQTDFRPIRLQQCYSTDGVVYAVEGRQEVRRLDAKYRYPGDLDCTIGFCVESVLARKPTLVFCSSKAEVEKVAIDVARIMDQELKTEGNKDFLGQAQLFELKTMLEMSCKQLDTTLAKTLPRGVAYHHAGLTSEERECVEKAFRERTIFALVATSTLSSGVNLPAALVIIKAQTRGPAALNNTSYSQMSGRAGRMGFVEYGESIVTIKPSEVDTALRLLATHPSVGNQKRDASKVILESVCSGLTTKVSSVVSLTSQLLHSPQQSPEQTISELASQALISCCDMEDEAQNEESEDFPLTATQLGRAALASSLPPDAALFVFADLKNAARALAIDTELHMMYLVTPINCSVWQGCDWDHLLTIFNRLDSNQKRISKMVGANEGFIIGQIRGKYSRPDDRQLQLHLRFFSALALFDVINEVPLTKVAEKFKICRGSLQALQQQSATYAAMIVAFCNRLGWQYLRSLLEGFASRLAFGIRAELTELIRVDGIDGSRARAFHDHGITSLAQLAQSTTAKVATVLSLAVPFESETKDGNRQVWLFGEEQMTLQEAAELVLSRAGEGVRETMRHLGIDVALPIIPSQKKPSQPVHPAVIRCINESANKRRSLSHSIAPSDYQMDSGMCRSPLLGIVNKCSEEIDTGNPNYSYSASTPIGQKRPPRISFPCSQIAEDSALDIFSSSIMEMSLNEEEVVTEEMERPINDQPIEIDDLETSLMKVAHDATQCDDSFEQTVELVNRGNTQIPVLSNDSFDLVSQLIIPKTQLPKKTSRLSTVSVVSRSRADGSSADLSVDLFESFENSPAVSMKRTRCSIGSWSPKVFSPVCKTSRRTKSLVHSFWIEDVCETESTWNAFVTKSTDWEQVSMALITEGSQVTAVCLCNSDQMPVFIPICDDNFTGTAVEEASYPSSTPCQNISLNRRVEQIRLIFRSCTVYCYSALKQVFYLRNSLNIEIPDFVCLEYLSFLAHYRTGDSPLSIAQLASRFYWQLDIQQLLKMSPRIKFSTQSFICSRIHERLRSTAVQLSSKDSISLEFSALQAVAHIRSIGFPFSNSLSTVMLRNIRSKISNLENECHQLAGKFFNLESPPSVSEVLFVRLKIPHPGGSVAGKRHLSASKTILNQVSHLHPIVPKIIVFRQLKHAISQCLLPLLEHVCPDDVIRCSFEMSTATGRILSFNPCVQNVGKGELFTLSGDGLSTRSLFAAKPERVLIGADYCQLELRVLAHLSADPALLKQLSDSDQDFFAELSRKWKFSRDSVKQLCYGLIYGMGVKTLADSTKMTTIEAQKLLDSFFTTFPKVKTYIANTKEQAEKVGFVETFLGRRRVACSKGRQEERSRDHRQSVNFTIQGTASEIFKKAIIQIHERLRNLDANTVMIVHDEIIVDCDSMVAFRVSEILRQEMENVFPNLRVPLKVKVVTGHTWADLK